VDLKQTSHPSTGVTPDGELSAPTPTATSTVTPVASLQCDECAAPVAEEQRYCVVCGAHRRHVSDPAARYLSQMSARSRATGAGGPSRRAPRRASRVSGIGVAVVLALIPAGAAVGVLAGRSSNNDDASLVRALSRRQAADRVVAAGGTTGSTASASTTGTGGHSTTGGSGHSKKSGHASSRKGHRRTASGKSNASSTKATPISTKAPSAAAKQTGAKVTQKVQKSTGKSYVKAQSGLPSTVVVP
jgi:hypothetical protein